MEAKFPVESGRGAECPYCKDEDFLSRGIEVSAKDGKLVFTETCSKCGKKWEEFIRVGPIQPPASGSDKTATWRGSGWRRWLGGWLRALAR